MKIIYEPDAEQELSDAAVFVAQRNSSIVAGERLLAEVAEAEAQIAAFPNAHPPVRGGFRRFLLRRFHYQLIYRYETETGTVRIWAFAHQSRKPGYWRKRLRQT